jgi:hypothetical protein
MAPYLTGVIEQRHGLKQTRGLVEGYRAASGHGKITEQFIDVEARFLIPETQNMSRLNFPIAARAPKVKHHVTSIENVAGYELAARVQAFGAPVAHSHSTRSCFHNRTTLYHIMLHFIHFL